MNEPIFYIKVPVVTEKSKERGGRKGKKKNTSRNMGETRVPLSNPHT